MRITVDRVEGEIAVLDVGGEIIDFPLAALPPEAKEGSVLAFQLLSNEAILKQGHDRLERLKARNKALQDQDEIEI